MNRSLNVLLIYPKYPNTFWSFKHALKFISKRALYPPLGLLTVAPLLPERWNKKLVDMNVNELTDKHLRWADYVFISAMTVQKNSVEQILLRCKQAGVKTICGGPLFTASHEDFEADHFILNEAEVTLPVFLKDLTNHIRQDCSQDTVPGKVYRSNEFPDIEKSPLPMWDLVDMKKYASMNIQYSRGCPFNCDFCDITTLFGKRVRTKSKHQIIAELDQLYLSKWQGDVFFVDDNFIGNTTKLKEEILPAIIRWNIKRKRPFTFSTEASINLADDKDLMRLMVKAGFDGVFVGIETPNEESLAECNKIQNKNRDMIKSINTIQSYGLEVTGGFIVGFDSDNQNVFQMVSDFIQKTGIVTAMVGLLNAPKNTPLFKKLQKQNRIIGNPTGSNTDMSMNFIPKMNMDDLMKGYKNILASIYSAKPYYDRVRYILSSKKFIKSHKLRFNFSSIKALVKSVYWLGIVDKARKYYWKMVAWAIFVKPRALPLAITYMIYGFHFRKIFGV
ncbi:DUF4070 domain-containing protein [Candidatus Woesearchaeota archaeon]|nr:DUF4070 domain-containing protein [Candidatus Woesearchaeota archaeon]